MSDEAFESVEVAWSRAVENGWAICGSGLDEIAATLQFRATYMPTRPGEPVIGRLSAVSSTAAKSPSLSREFGLGTFPLHTDGAHLKSPPDAVLLEFDCDTEAAPTLVHRLDVEDLEEPVRSALRHGIFEIGFGPASFLGVVATTEGIRFDSAAMQPRDRLAAIGAEYLGDCLARARSVPLTGSGATLVIDNRRTLHGRAPVARPGIRRGRRLMLRWSS